VKRRRASAVSGCCAARLQYQRRGVGGLHCLPGVAAEIGVIMLIYLDEAFHSLKAGNMTDADVGAAVHDGALERLWAKHFQSLQPDARAQG
jgi:Cu/Ag efflux pump CusA